MQDSKSNLRQMPIESFSPSETWDVAIVGAGPAGSTAAVHLATAGFRVLLIDRKSFPRDKSCGDALAPDAQRALAGIGLLEKVRCAGNAIESAIVVSPSGVKVEIPGRFVTLKRQRLDAIMAARAVEAGAIFCHGNVERVETGAANFARCVFSGGDQQCRARIVVVATGANVGLLESLGLVQRPQASGIAARYYVKSRACLEQMVFRFDRQRRAGYGWIFPMGHQIYNVGCISFHGRQGAKQDNIKQMLDRFVSDFDLARELVNDGEPMTPLCGARVRCGLKGIHLAGTDNVLAIGETIGATFSASGEGIGKAMETAVLASGAISQSLHSGSNASLRGFADSVERQMRGRFRSYEIAQRWVSRPWLCDLVWRRVRKSAFLQRAFADIIEENTEPGEVFSLKGMLRALYT